MAAKGCKDVFAIKDSANWAIVAPVPSGRLPSAWRRAGEDLTEDERLERKAAVGLAGGKLSTKLDKRYHISSGSRMVRVCVCEYYTPDSLELHVPQPSCPGRLLGPAISRIARAEERLLPK